MAEQRFARDRRPVIIFSSVGMRPPARETWRSAIEARWAIACAESVRGLKHETDFTMGAIVIVLAVIVAWKVPALRALSACGLRDRGGQSLVSPPYFAAWHDYRSQRSVRLAASKKNPTPFSGHFALVGVRRIPFIQFRSWSYY